jgi:hypothetical protein
MAAGTVNTIPAMEVSEWSGFDLFFHAIAFTLDKHRFGVVQQAVEDGGSQRAVIVEDLGPVFVRPV